MSLSSPRPSTIVAITVGTAFASLAAYAIYFDYRRRNDPEFRRALRRESRKLEKMQKAEDEAKAASRERAIYEAVEKLNAEEYPSITSPDAVEAFFMEQIAQADQLGREDKVVESASYLFRALKVYPRKTDFLGVLDHTVQNKDVLTTLARMISIDESMLNAGPS